MKYMIMGAVALTLGLAGCDETAMTGGAAKGDVFSGTDVRKENTVNTTQTDVIVYKGNAYNVQPHLDRGWVLVAPAKGGFDYYVKDLVGVAEQYTGCKGRFDPGALGMIPNFETMNLAKVMPKDESSKRSGGLPVKLSC